MLLPGAGLAGAEAPPSGSPRRPRVLIGPADQPALIAGVGTAYLEMFAAGPDLDAVLVPVGSGTGAAAAGWSPPALAPAAG